MKRNLFIIILAFPTLGISGNDGGIPMKLRPMASWGYKHDTSIVRAGEISERFEVRHGDCFQISDDWNDCSMDRERAELSSRDTKRFDPNSDIWIGWSLFIPKDFTMGYKMLTIAGQLHREGGPIFGSGKTLNKPPLFAFFLASNAAGLAVWNTKTGDKIQPDYIFSTKDVASHMAGKWNDIAVNFNNKNKINKLMFYVNGKKVGTKDNVEIGNPDFYYFKYGIYRSHLSGHLKKTGTPLGTQVLYFDEVRFGSSLDDVKIDPQRPLN